MEVVMIDGVTYRVVAEENNFATQTPYDAIRRLIHNNRERICCLGPDGGKYCPAEYLKKAFVRLYSKRAKIRFRLSFEDSMSKLRAK